MFKQKKRRSREFKSSNKVIDFEQAREDRRARRKNTVTGKPEKARKISKAELTNRKINMRNRKRLIYSSVILCIALVIGVSVFHVFALQKEYTETIAQKKELQKTKQDLQEELGNVNNPEYVEQQARQQLKMVKPGEVLYIVPHESISGAAVTSVEDGELLPAGEASD